MHQELGELLKRGIYQMSSNEEFKTLNPSPTINQQPLESKSQENALSINKTKDSQLLPQNIYVALTNRLKRYRQWQYERGNIKNILRRISWGKVFELALIGLWAIWVGRNYLDFNPFSWPNGREFGAQVQTHHFWTQFLRCGICSLWNGNINGGYPSLADVFGSTLHPLIAITTSLWGVVAGAKIAVVFSLAIAGLAQWMIANTLRLGRVARVWTALMVIVGGHLTGRLETPTLAIIYSTAMASLTLAVALHLGINKSRRTTILLAILGAITIVSGQGYMQLSLLAWGPAFLFFILNEHFRLRPIGREFILAISLSLLLAGIFIVPLVHFWPQVAKAGDIEFKSAQPLEYIPLNLFIRDQEFLKGSLLNKMPFPALYNLYIGWTPVLLAMLCLVLAKRRDLSALLCLTSGMLLMFVMASAIPLRWLEKIIPMISGFRHTPLFAGLAIPALLGLAGYGLDHLIKLKWPQVNLHLRPNVPEFSKNISLTWLLIIPLVLSLQAAYKLSQNWFITTDSQTTYESMTYFQTPNLQWVTFPYGEHYWIEPALDNGLKITNVVWAWDWIDRKPPEPKLEANRGGQPVNTERIGDTAGVPLYLHNENEYAFVDFGDQIVPCMSSGSGGNLTIECSTNIPGRLIVKENSWSGWLAWQDGNRISLLPSSWLSVEAPSGDHVYRFRYLPIDVLCGFILTLIGVAIVFILWRRDSSLAIEDE
jgi:hypothetical protein